MPLKLQNGDVLLYSEPVNKAVLFGQKLIRFGRDLNANMVHAGIVTKGGDISPFATHGVDIAHAVMGGVKVEQLRVSGHKTYGSWGRVDIWRPPARLGIANLDAAKIAATWGGPGKMPFATRKAFQAGFGSSSFGKGAQHRLLEYQAYKDQAGGPPSLHDPSIGKSVYCSMFVVAVYQAALGSVAVSEMNVDARHVSPMKLHDVLNRKGWDYVGAAWDSGSGIKVVKHNGDFVN